MFINKGTMLHITVYHCILVGFSTFVKAFELPEIQNQAFYYHPKVL